MHPSPSGHSKDVLWLLSQPSLGIHCLLMHWPCARRFCCLVFFFEHLIVLTQVTEQPEALGWLHSSLRRMCLWHRQPRRRHCNCTDQCLPCPKCEASLVVLSQETPKSGQALHFRYEEDMEERLDVSIRRIVQQNKRTAMELQLHVEESSMLQDENKVLTQERRRLQRARPFHLTQCSFSQWSIRLWPKLPLSFL